MAEVKIRKLPDWVVEEHKRNAEREGRSLEEELRILLTDKAAGKKSYWEQRLEELNAEIRAKHGSIPTTTEDIREERERQG